MTNLPHVISFALSMYAQSGDVDDAGRPAILNPLRRMVALDPFQWNDSPEDSERLDTLLCVAVTYAVLRDTSTPLRNLIGWPAPIIEALQCLFRLPEESQTQFDRRRLSNPIAHAVGREWYQHPSSPQPPYREIDLGDAP
jgi:hypothetical protein